MALNRTLKYLVCIPHLAIYYDPNVQPNRLITFSNANYVNNFDDRKSQSSYAIFSNAKPISWGSIKQCCPTSNTIDVEYISTTFLLPKKLFGLGNKSSNHWISSTKSHSIAFRLLSNNSTCTNQFKVFEKNQTH